MSQESTGNLLIYQTEDGRARVECRLVHQTIWLSQALMGELFDRSKKTVSEHLQNLFEEGELDPDSVVRNFRTTAADGKAYDVAHYNLQAELLASPGSVSHEDMKAIASELYDNFDAQRRQHEATEADAEDLKAIEDLEKNLQRTGGKP